MRKCSEMKNRTKIKPIKLPICGERLLTDFGGIGYYKILKIYEWKEYVKSAVTPSGNHWFKNSMAKIKAESGIVMKIPFIELGLKSVYADSGERIMK